MAGTKAASGKARRRGRAKGIAAAEAHPDKERRGTSEGEITVAGVPIDKDGLMIRESTSCGTPQLTATM